MAASQETCNEPQNLRKAKPIPPPLDLSTRHSLDTLNEFATIALSPRSPLLHNQKHLPFRKRAFSWTNFSELNQGTQSPSCSSGTRTAYASWIPASPRCHRLPIIKQEPNFQGEAHEEVDESQAFLTPVTPGPLSPLAFPSSPFSGGGGGEGLVSGKFAHNVFWGATSALLSPAASLHSNSQEELALMRSARYDDVFHTEEGEFRTRKDLLEEKGATAELCEQFQRFDFAVPAARTHERRVQSSSEEAASPGPSTATKRPMNGFMLFAQKHRLQLIQQYPGRDNRAISVLLGDAWKKLSLAERELYTAEAHLRAEEYRRLHPDCWKRKRSKSTS